MSGVASRNPFALLGDDADIAAATPAPKAAPAAAPTPAQAQRNNVTGAAARGNNRPQRGGARGGAARAPRPEGAAAGGDAPSGEQRDSRRGPGEGRGRGGRGRGRGGRGRGREFDRHSQTNKDETDKQVRQAWGGEDGKRELETEEKGEADAQAEGAEAADAAAPNGAPSSDKPAPIEEEPDNTKTYDEYLAELTAKKATLGGGAKEARTAADEENWKNFSVTKAARDESEYFAATQKENTKSQKERKQKNILEIETRFESPRQERTERGGRGGRGRGAGRGGRGRGAARGGRGGSQSNASVNLADQSAFPSLG